MTQTSSCVLLRKFTTSECTVQHMILIQDLPIISVRQSAGNHSKAWFMSTIHLSIIASLCDCLAHLSRFINLYHRTPVLILFPIETAISEEGHEVVPGLFLEPGALPLWAGPLPHHTNWTQYQLNAQTEWCTSCACNIAALILHTMYQINNRVSAQMILFIILV